MLAPPRVGAARVRPIPAAETPQRRKQNRIVYICPLPLEAFKLEFLQKVDDAIYGQSHRGIEAYRWQAVLKRVNRFMLYFCHVGLWDGNHLALHWKVWADDCLVRMPTTQEMIEFGTQEIQRFAKPDRWATNTTLEKMLRCGMVHFDQGMFWYEGTSIGVSEKLHDDKIYTGRTTYASSVTVPYPA